MRHESLSGDQFISKAKAALVAERESVMHARDDVAAAQMSVEAAKQALSIAEINLTEREARLQGVESMFALFEDVNSESNSSDDAPKRRMRLGAKKRAIYTLVSNRVNSLEQITNHLVVVHKTDIDRRYIRDVVRDAISDGDMQGDIEHDFIMSDDGREILDKAPIPKGWEAYKDAAEMRPVVSGLPSAMPVPTNWGDATPHKAKTQHADNMQGFLNPQPSPSRAQD